MLHLFHRVCFAMLVQWLLHSFLTHSCPAHAWELGHLRSSSYGLSSYCICLWSVPSVTRQCTTILRACSMVYQAQATPPICIPPQLVGRTTKLAVSFLLGLRWFLMGFSTHLHPMSHDLDAPLRACKIQLPIGGRHMLDHIILCIVRRTTTFCMTN
ncbi:hypothetical protein EI94DRAFT_529888 [Lactarius quietus]|nr:hypothetical protein EI94DRAFT_529888 [Lactarius quietus]